MATPAQLAATAEAGGLPDGSDDRFAGYAVMGLPFSTGHVLAMRRFPASSIGPAYSSVWHRDPKGSWAFYQDQADEYACGNYFSEAVDETRLVDIELDWVDATTLQVRVAAIRLDWSIRVEATPTTGALSRISRALPDRLWRSEAFLSAMGPIAGMALRAGRIRLVGTAPNGQHFRANPEQLWVIRESTASIDGAGLGEPAPLDVQTRLGDFLVPQRGIFTIGRAFFTT